MSAVGEALLRTAVIVSMRILEESVVLTCDLRAWLTVRSAGGKLTSNEYDWGRQESIRNPNTDYSCRNA